MILASYNSGSARVKNIIQEKGDEWLKDPALQEAFKYVNKVSSFCFHFSQGVNEDDT